MVRFRSRRAPNHTSKAPTSLVFLGLHSTAVREARASKRPVDGRTNAWSLRTANQRTGVSLATAHVLAAVRLLRREEVSQQYDIFLTEALIEQGNANTTQETCTVVMTVSIHPHVIGETAYMRKFDDCMPAY